MQCRITFNTRLKIALSRVKILCSFSYVPNQFWRLLAIFLILQNVFLSLFLMYDDNFSVVNSLTELSVDESRVALSGQYSQCKYLF